MSNVALALTTESTPGVVTRSRWHAITHRPIPLACLIAVAIYTILGVISYTPLLDNKIIEVVGDTYQTPTLRHLDLILGTDVQGRSVFWRLLYGTRVALTITLCTSILSLGIGVTLGVLAGFYGGWVDDLITWLFTTVSSVPWMLLVVALVYVFRHRPIHAFGGEYELSELQLVILALGLTDWVGICRLIRGEVLKHRDRDYVHAARAAGVGNARILFRHILPNVMHLVIITFSLGAVGYLQAEVALTFIGLGISDKPSWGRMIDDSRLELMHGVWWQLVAASVAIGIISLALNLLGDALRDALDPELRGLD